MKLKNLINILPILLCLFFLPSCNDNFEPDDNNPDKVVKEYDWRLIGEWEQENDVTGKYPTDFTFNEDGTGSCDKGKLKWFTSNHKLFLKIGKSKEFTPHQYSIFGVRLAFGNDITYKTNLPFMGVWFAENAFEKFEGKTFMLEFMENSQCAKVNFERDGTEIQKSYSWERTKTGVTLRDGILSESLIFDVKDGKLTLKDNGVFVNALPWFGKWESATNDKGDILPNSDEYSMVELSRKNGENFISCTYKTADAGGNIVKSSFQGKVKVLYWNNRKLLVTDHNIGNGDAILIDFRTHFHGGKQKLMMQLSSDKFRTWTDYQPVKE